MDLLKMLKQLILLNTGKYWFYRRRISHILCLSMIILLISLFCYSNKLPKTPSLLILDENPIRSQVTITDLVVNSAWVIYDHTYTRTADNNLGYGLGSITASNQGLVTINLTGIELYFINESLEWENITQRMSFQDISPGNPFRLEAFAINEQVSIRFVLPELNQQNITTYKITIEDDNGTIWDTSEEQAVDPDEMQLLPDQPNIEFSGFPQYIRRVYSIGPSVSDNSEIKNVTYEIYTNPLDILGSQVRKKTVSSLLWRWLWDTRRDTPEGVENGTYHMRITVNDYAGLSSSVVNLNMTIDNDYIAPYISTILLGREYLELGESFAIFAIIEDSGSYASDVHNAYLYYKLKTETVFSTVLMTQIMANNWSATIPPSAIVGAIDFYIAAEDFDSTRYESPTYSLYSEGMTTIIEPTTTETTSDLEPTTPTTTITSTTSTTSEEETSSNTSTTEKSITSSTSSPVIADTSYIPLMYIPLAILLFILIPRRKKKEIT
jgi:hypothetical protein